MRDEMAWGLTAGFQMSDSHRAFDRLCFLLVWAPGWPPAVLVGGRWDYTGKNYRERSVRVYLGRGGSNAIARLKQTSHNGSWAQMTCRKPRPKQGML